MTDSFDHDRFRELRLLTAQALDGTLSREGTARLETLLDGSASMRAYYRDYLSVYCDLSMLAGMQEAGPCSLDDNQDETFWEMLAEYEKNAPAMETPSLFEQPPLVEKVVYPPRPKQPVSKFTAASVIISLAALLMLVLFVHYIPSKLGYEVATLDDAIDAKWVNSAGFMGQGARLRAGYDALMLREGLVQILFDNGARVVVEGPAEFQLLAEDQLRLTYGSVYAVVPDRAYGFTVITETSRIIDLGTEFGVRSDMDGDMEVHVIKGKVNLLSGTHERRENITMAAGTAKRLTARTGELSTAACSESVFARSIDSKAGTVWRGQKTIDLADMAGGGNGLGTGRRGSCIDTATGEWTAESYLPPAEDTVRPGTRMKCTYRLLPVKSNPFIDAVFIPDGDQGPVDISTGGHSFDAFPDTSGLGWGGIVHLEDTLLNHRIALNGQRYGVAGMPALFMHGNAGITFDLNQIRDAYAGSLTAFTADYGIADDYFSSGAGCPAYADFWVLVDGRVRFCQTGVQVHQGGSIRVALSPEDRFLTLVTTDGGPESPQFDDRTSFNDWSLFGRPVLLTE